MDFISAARQITKRFITDTQQIQLYNNVLNDKKLSTDEKISKLLALANRFQHEEVMNALIKNMSMDLYGNLEDADYEIIQKFYARRARKAAERIRKESVCNAKEGDLPAIGQPTISTEDNPEISMYKWEDGRVVSVVESDDDDGHIIQGNLKTYSDKFTANTAAKGDEYREVLVDATKERVNINLVYLGKGSGICTLGVASVLYAVLDQANMIGWFPSSGHVHIMSLNGCRAFNCYNRAFMLNGFELDPNKNQYDIVHEYANIGYGSEVEDGEFTYDLYYVSTKQKQKEIKYKQHEKKSVFHQYVCDSCIHNLSEK